MIAEIQINDNVSKKILEDALLQKQKIIEDANNKEKEIIDSAENKRKNILEKAKLDAETRYRRVYDLEIAKAKSGADHKVLLKKISIVDEIVRLAAEKLKSIDQGQYLTILREIIESINIATAEYQIGRKESIFSDDIIKEVAGGEGGILKKSEEPADFDSGIKIIEGKKEYFISAESLIKDKIDDIGMEIANFLFKKE